MTSDRAGAVRLARARSMRREATTPERVLWQALRDRQVGGWKFRRQVPVGAYIVDFLCYEARLVVEADGASHADGVAADGVRDAWLAGQGFRVLRVWNGDIMGNLAGVLERILAACLG